MPPEYLTIARITAPHGMRGEVKAEILSDFPERFGQLRYVFVGPKYDRMAVVFAQRHRRGALFRLEGIDTIEQAEALRGKLVQVPVAEAPALAEDQFYWHQIIGLVVEDTAGNSIGRVVDILRTGVNDVYLVDADGKEVLIPAIEDVVKKVDLARGRMIVELMPGLLD